MLSEPVFAADLVSHHNIQRALAIAAHPDDIDFGGAGTIAGLTSAGVHVTYCLITSGDAGGFEPGETRESMVMRREQEQRDAAKIAGVAEVIYLKHRDGHVEASHELSQQIVELTRTVRPDIVIGQHPQRNWEKLQASHPDHLAAGEATVRAMYPAVENPFAYPQLAHLPPFKVRQLWMMGAPKDLVNLRVDITQTVDTKLQALHAHVSQHPDPSEMDQRVRDAVEANHPTAGRAAECFHAVAINDETTFAGF